MQKTMHCFVKFGMAASVFWLAGCATVKMPMGGDLPQVAALSADAPLVAAAYLDARSSESMGKICLKSMKAKRTEVQESARHYLKSVLASFGYRSEFVAPVDFSNQTSIASAAKNLKAKGLIYLRMDSVRVASFDLILDPPKYTAKGHVVVYDPEGKSVYQTPISGEVSSQAAFDKGQGQATSESIQRAIFELMSDPRFSKVLKSLKEPEMISAPVQKAPEPIQEVKPVVAALEQAEGTEEVLEDAVPANENQDTEAMEDEATESEDATVPKTDSAESDSAMTEPDETDKAFFNEDAEIKSIQEDSEITESGITETAETDAGVTETGETETL